MQPRLVPLLVISLAGSAQRSHLSRAALPAPSDIFGGLSLGANGQSASAARPDGTRQAGAGFLSAI